MYYLVYIQTKYHKIGAKIRCFHLHFTAALGMLTEKYGEPETCIEKFQNSYVDDDSSKKHDTSVEGDINGDGEFSVSDLVLLQKWLA